MSVRRVGLVALLIVGLASSAQAQRHKKEVPPAGPSDAQILHIVGTASDIDVKAAQMALKNSKTKDIRAFAAAMVRDHKKVADQTGVLARDLRVVVENNATSKALVEQAKQDREQLRTLKGADFDKAYIEHEVAYHKAVGATLSGTLIPNAKAPELKAFLSQSQGLFQAHQQRAEELAAKWK